MGAKKQIKELNADLDESFKNVGIGFDDVHRRINSWAHQHRAVRNEFNELRDELATNGVVRDLRKLEKAHAEFERQTVAFMDSVDARFAELGTNGVATQINNLTREVFKDKKEESSPITRVMYAMAGAEAPASVTLAGKVEAIIEHLGLDISVKPQEVTPAKVEVKKKPVTKKKGRR